MAALAERERIDAFHARFNAGAAAASSSSEGAGGAGDRAQAASGAKQGQEKVICGGCGASIERSDAQWCGGCRCSAYCGKECQRAGWKVGGHKAACKLLARARALPPAAPERRYVVQLKLLGREGLREWGDKLEKSGEPDLAGVQREMATALAPRERVLLALEARHHALLGFEIVPARKRLEASDLALFALRAMLEPATDVPTLNMLRSAPQRPYAIWIPTNPTAPCERSMAQPVGAILEGAGLVTSECYVGGGFCAESRLHPELRSGDDCGLGLFAELDPDYYSEDEDEGPEPRREEEREEAPAGGAGGGRTRLLVVAGLHVFGAAREADDPFLAAMNGALRSGGLEVEVAMYPSKGGRAGEEQLARRLTDGGFAACVVLGLGASCDFRPRNPTHPWGPGPWRDALTGWVGAGGVLVVHGERPAAAVLRSFFGLSWGMDGDFYRRTDHVLHPACPLLGGLARRLPPTYNVKACMLSGVPPGERVYAATPGATTYSNVPSMAGHAVDAGACAMAVARYQDGAVVFFGDVNWEPHTTEAVTQLVRELVAQVQVGRR